MKEKSVVWLLGIGHLLLVPMVLWYIVGQWWTMAIPLFFGMGIGESPPGESMVQFLTTGDLRVLASPSTFYLGGTVVSACALALIAFPSERERKRDLMLGVWAPLGIVILGTASSFVSGLLLLAYPFAIFALVRAAYHFGRAAYGRFSERRFSWPRASLAMGVASLAVLLLVGMGIVNMMLVGGS